MNTTDVTRFGRWPKMTTERTIYELKVMQFRDEYQRTCKHLDLAMAAISLFITLALSLIIVTL